MSFKTNDKHWENIVNYMENHTDFAKGRLKSSPEARKKSAKLWKTFSEQLNSFGYRQRSTVKWQKVSNT